MSADLLSALNRLHDEANRCARLADSFGLRSVSRAAHALRIEAPTQDVRELADELLAVVNAHLQDLSTELASFDPLLAAA